MANEAIQISLGEVSACASNIRTLNGELSVTLENIKSKMNALAQNWQSEGSETIRANFNNMSASFEDYRAVIDSYAVFLDDTVTAYETTETSISRNADLFK